MRSEFTWSPEEAQRYRDLAGRHLTVLRADEAGAEGVIEGSFTIEDASRVARQLNAGAAIAGFPLARRDVPDHFRIPQRLYGREEEVSKLLNAFEKAYDKVSLALVSGRALGWVA